MKVQMMPLTYDLVHILVHGCIHRGLIPGVPVGQVAHFIVPDLEGAGHRSGEEALGHAGLWPRIVMSIRHV